MDTLFSCLIEETPEGFLACRPQNPSCYAYGATEEEAREALYEMSCEAGGLLDWDEWN